MIHKVYIVRCSYCHGSLREPLSTDFRPRYFYSMDAIKPALEEAGWKVVSGTEVCKKCIETYSRSEL